VLCVRAFLRRADARWAASGRKLRRGGVAGARSARSATLCTGRRDCSRGSGTSGRKRSGTGGSPRSFRPFVGVGGGNARRGRRAGGNGWGEDGCAPVPPARECGRRERRAGPAGGRKRLGRGRSRTCSARSRVWAEGAGGGGQRAGGNGSGKDVPASVPPARVRRRTTAPVTGRFAWCRSPTGAGFARSEARRYGPGDRPQPQGRRARRGRWAREVRASASGRDVSSAGGQRCRKRPLGAGCRKRPLGAQRLSARARALRGAMPPR